MSFWLYFFFEPILYEETMIDNVGQLLTRNYHKNYTHPLTKQFILLVDVAYRPSIDDNHPTKICVTPPP